MNAQPIHSSTTAGSAMNNLNQSSRWKEMFHFIPPVLLRLVVGYGFMEHGFAKLARGPDAFAAILQGIGVPFAHFMTWSTIAVEILGGLAVLLGAFVALASLPMAAVLLVAIFTVHARYGFSSIKLMAVTAAGPRFGPPGVETNLLYLACLAALVIGGSGPVAIDALIKRSRKAEEVAQK
jgi:putative oxidoreductase